MVVCMAGSSRKWLGSSWLGEWIWWGNARWHGELIWPAAEYEWWFCSDRCSMSWSNVILKVRASNVHKPSPSITLLQLQIYGVWVWCHEGVVAPLVAAAVNVQENHTAWSCILVASLLMEIIVYSFSSSWDWVQLELHAHSSPLPSWFCFVLSEFFHWTWALFSQPLCLWHTL